MAQLTLSQRGIMATDGQFHQRLRAAIKKTAHYWNDKLDGNELTAVFKRKVFAKQILSGNLPDMRSYAEFFLSMYNTEQPVMDGDNLADSELINSDATPITYDYFAGVEPKDLQL